MEIDSTAVTRALAREVFPLLRERGFGDIKGRKAWRGSEHAVCIVSFASLGAYSAERLGLTSHSFGGSAGVYYKALHTVPWADGTAPARPEDFRCHARLFLRKDAPQAECARPDVWYVDPAGRHLEDVLADVRRAVHEQALPWIDDRLDPRRALDAFETREDSEMQPGIGLERLGGRLGSLARAEVASALALACGDPERARRAWGRMLSEPYYATLPDLRALAERRMAAI